MASADESPAKAVLAQVDRSASRLLVLLSLLTLASLVFGEQNPVTELLVQLLIFMGGMVLGILWCTLALSRHSRPNDADE